MTKQFPLVNIFITVLIREWLVIKPQGFYLDYINHSAYPVIIVV